jgi:phage gp36-like protein
MAYSTATQVKEILLKVNTNVISDAAIDGQIARADSDIDSKLGGIYDVPFSPIPAIINTISTFLASYFVMLTFFMRDSQNKSEWVDKLQSNAKGYLDEILQNKRLVLDSEGEEVSQRGSSLKSNTEDFQPVFDMDPIIDSKVDPDLLDEIADSRG